MSKLVESLADVNEIFSIEDAAQQGYRCCLEADGCALVTKADGTHYRVEHWHCDCADAIHRNGGSYQLPNGRVVCKHVLLVMQAYPCGHCGGTMVYLGGRFFECYRCGNARDIRLIKEERREALQEAEGGPQFHWDAETIHQADKDTLSMMLGQNGKGGH